mmetsp:Transcript_3807/g.6336  ORF Transcript_3807/g.6336 Transcript_3807/m.6336 type:complete len:211 (+) Transcript_3807:43-675(+)
MELQLQDDGIGSQLHNYDMGLQLQDNNGEQKIHVNDIGFELQNSSGGLIRQDNAVAMRKEAWLEQMASGRSSPKSTLFRSPPKKIFPSMRMARNYQLKRAVPTSCLPNFTRLAVAGKERESSERQNPNEDNLLTLFSSIEASSLSFVEEGRSSNDKQAGVDQVALFQTPYTNKRPKAATRQEDSYDRQLFSMSIPTRSVNRTLEIDNEAM